MQGMTEHIPTWTLGERMWKARRDAGLSTSAMADALDVSANTVGNYEAGRTTPTTVTLREWARITGVSHTWLVGEGRPVRRHVSVPARKAATARSLALRGSGRHARRRRPISVIRPAA